jgi:hypothetical protein
MEQLDRNLYVYLNFIYKKDIIKISGKKLIIQ